MPPRKPRRRLLYRVDDAVEVRDVDPPILARVVVVEGTLVRVAYTDEEGRAVRRWVTADVLRQMTVSGVMRGDAAVAPASSIVNTFFSIYARHCTWYDLRYLLTLHPCGHVVGEPLAQPSYLTNRTAVLPWS